MVQIKLNLQKLNNAVQNAFDDLVEIQSQALDEAIASDIWEWDGETKRSNGDTVGSPRDIVDTGELIDSKVISRRDYAVKFDWSATHADIVHEGATTKTGKKIPARPWTERALEQVDLEEEYAKLLQSKLR